jgi:hypothetical protein
MLCVNLGSYIRYFKQEVLGRTNRLFSLIRHGPHRKRRVSQFFYCCVYIRCCGNVFTEPLPSNDMGYIYRHTDWWEGLMKHAVKMASGAMIYLPTPIKISSGFQKWIRGYTDTQRGDRTGLFLESKPETAKVSLFQTVNLILTNKILSLWTTFE